MVAMSDDAEFICTESFNTIYDSECQDAAVIIVENNADDDVDGIMDSEDIQPVKSAILSPDARYLRGLNLAITVTALGLSLCLASLDQTILTTAIPRIATDFNSFNQISWIGTAYLLTSVSFQPLYGKFADIFGTKKILLFALIVFLGGSIGCGAAQSMNALIVCRAIAGIGGDGIIVLTLIGLTDIVTPEKRDAYMGIFAGFWALSAAFGPLLGGFFVDHVSWRWAFYISLPIGELFFSSYVHGH